MQSIYKKVFKTVFGSISPLVGLIAALLIPVIVIAVTTISANIITTDGNIGIGTTSPGGLLGFQDSNTYIDVDIGNNLTFTDVVTGTKTLAELAAGGAV